MVKLSILISEVMTLIVATKVLDPALSTSVQLIVVPFRSLVTTDVVNIDTIELDLVSSISRNTEGVAVNHERQVKARYIGDQLSSTRKHSN